MGLVIAIQEGNGPIVPLSKEVLQTIMKDDSELLHLIEKGRYGRAIVEYNKKAKAIPK